MTSIMSQAWQAVKPHVPLIRFRKGVDVIKEVINSSGAVGGKNVAASTNRPVIEDYQLPRRYQRTPLDDKEIEAINSGGAY